MALKIEDYLTGIFKNYPYSHQKIRNPDTFYQGFLFSEVPSSISESGHLLS